MNPFGFFVQILLNLIKIYAVNGKDLNFLILLVVMVFGTSLKIKCTILVFFISKIGTFLIKMCLCSHLSWVLLNLIKMCCEEDKNLKFMPTMVWPSGRCSWLTMIRSQVQHRQKHQMISFHWFLSLLDKVTLYLLLIGGGIPWNQSRCAQASPDTTVIKNNT